MYNLIRKYISIIYFISAVKWQIYIFIIPYFSILVTYEIDFIFPDIFPDIFPCYIVIKTIYYSYTNICIYTSERVWKYSGAHQIYGGTILDNYKDWLYALLKTEPIPPEDIPDIGLYMDQVTTLMDTRLAGSKRYPDDKILTKTMINNYTKNHLLPPSDKKKYSREHVFLLIMIYYLKSMLSISDIQSLLEPLSEKYFPKNEENGLTLSDIYQKIIDDNTANEEAISEDIIKTWERTRNSFAEHSPSTEESEYLDDFSFIYQLGYDIYIRKQIIEKLIDQRRKENPPKKKGSKKK